MAVPTAFLQVGGPGAVQAAARQGPMTLLAAHGVPTTSRPVVALAIPLILEGPTLLEVRAAPVGPNPEAAALAATVDVRPGPTLPSAR